MQLSLKSDKKMVTFYEYEYQYTFLTACRSFLLIMKNISDNSYRKQKKTHSMFNIFFRNLAVYEIMWKNTVEAVRPQMKL